MEPVRHMMNHLRGDMQVVLSSTLLNLVVAAVLGGIIGLERQLRHKPAGLRTNMFICFGAAMFTLLSKQIAGVPADQARIAAQIIPGIGFIGAGSILHARGSISGLTTAATLFVVASVGMAAGAGLYVTATFATFLIFIALHLLGRLEGKFSLKFFTATYEVLGKDAELVIAELNRILDTENCKTQNLRVAKGDGQTRVVFNVDAPRDEQEQLKVLLHQSSVFYTVSSLGSVEHE